MIALFFHSIPKITGRETFKDRMGEEIYEQMIKQEPTLKIVLPPSAALLLNSC